MICFNENFFGKIRIIFDIKNWLCKSEIGTFRSLNLEDMLIYQNFFKVQKCYLSLNLGTIWCGSCWKILKMVSTANYVVFLFWNFQFDYSRMCNSGWIILLNNFLNRKLFKLVTGRNFSDLVQGCRNLQDQVRK